MPYLAYESLGPYLIVLFMSNHATQTSGLTSGMTDIHTWVVGHYIIHTGPMHPCDWTVIDVVILAGHYALLIHELVHK